MTSDIIPAEVVLLQQARDKLAQEWEQRSPSSPAEIADFYVNAQHYKEDLDNWHQFPSRLEWTDAIIRAAHACKAVSILDIGAGAGHDITALRNDNRNYWVEAIEPNKILQEHLLNKVPVQIVHDDFTSVGDPELNGVNIFDMIYCIDVLEHLPDPEALLSDAIKHLKSNGIFIEATATDDIDTPLHLSSLRGWDPAKFLDEHGFVLEASVDRLRIWHRKSETRTSDPSLLLCAYRTVGAETAAVLTQLTKKNWRFSIHLGDALVSRVRSIAVSEWYQQDAGDVFLMIDDDILFAPEDAQKIIDLARETKSIASAAYPVRGATHFASRIPYTELKFGMGTEPCEITWAGTGFIAVHRDVIDAIVKTMPLCIMHSHLWFWPMFQPFVWHNEDKGYDEYLSEDWAFCERARQLGFKVWLDPSVILTHVGSKQYTVFDMMQLEEENAKN